MGAAGTQRGGNGAQAGRGSCYKHESEPCRTLIFACTPPEVGLAQALEARGLKLRVAHTGAEALTLVREGSWQAVLVDMAASGGRGWQLARDVNALTPTPRFVLLASVTSFFTGIDALRQGATDYLLQPIQAEQVIATLDAATAPNEATSPRFPTLERMQWEYIQMVLARCGGNISHAARRLGVHRQSLQRTLRQHGPGR
jgi:two-component system response regulator RegA